MNWIMNIKIPFMAEWHNVMLDGKKTCTSRNKRYGKIGDTFEVFGARYEITQIEQRNLLEVTANFYLAEGCETSNEFIAVWDKIYPHKLWRGSQIVWVHHFKRLQEVIEYGL